MTRTASTNGNSSRCPTPLDLARVATTRAVLPHVRECPDCAAILAEFRCLEEGLRAMRFEVFPRSRRERADATTSRRVKLVMAAALFLGALVAGTFGPIGRVSMGPDVWRGAIRVLDAEASALSPTTVRVRWTQVAAAASYHVSLLDRDGFELSRAILLADCSNCEVTLRHDSPETVRYWTVDALTAEALRMASAAGALEPGR